MVGVSSLAAAAAHVQLARRKALCGGRGAPRRRDVLPSGWSCLQVVCYCCQTLHCKVLMARLQMLRLLGLLWLLRLLGLLCHCKLEQQLVHL